MINSIKFIIERRNLQQKDLTTECIQKQAVSRWIRRERKVNKQVIPLWEEILNVPSQYFVDNDGLCKMLTSEEMIDLEKYLASHPIKKNKSKEEESSQKELIERRISIDNSIRSLIRYIRQDIYSLDDKSSFSLDNQYSKSEYELYFYKTLVRLKLTKAINDIEWHSTLEAFMYLMTNSSDTNLSKASELTKDLFAVFKKHRYIRENNQKNDLEVYKEIFGDEKNDDIDE